MKRRHIAIMRIIEGKQPKHIIYKKVNTSAQSHKTVCFFHKRILSILISNASLFLIFSFTLLGFKQQIQDTIPYNISHFSVQVFLILLPHLIFRTPFFIAPVRIRKAVHEQYCRQRCAHEPVDRVQMFKRQVYHAHILNSSLYKKKYTPNPSQFPVGRS